jgi:alginate O-acetyltransferase complex protein AlgJ
MTPASPSSPVRRVADAGLIALFLVVLWLPTWDWLWGLDRSLAPNENRKLAEFPKFSAMTFPGPYLAAFGEFFQDHFGFRKQLVHWNVHWKQKFFNESPVKMALQGRDGWLYWASEGMLENYTGQSQFKQSDLQNWQKLLEARRDWLAERGEKYLFVVAPNKESIYPEYLPEWVVKTGRPGKLDQFLAYMRAHSTVPILDLRPSLIEAKKDGPTYLVTDTHWNSFGGFIAYQQIIRALQPQVPGLQPLALNAFSRTPTIGHGGDLAVCIQQQDQMQETQAIIFKPRWPLAPLKQAGTHNRFTEGVVTKNPDQSGKAVIFRDSFAEALAAFMGYHFNEVLYIWQPQWDKELLEVEKPDLVIDEIVERHFNNESPQQLLLSDEKPPRGKYAASEGAAGKATAKRE